MQRSIKLFARFRPTKQIFPKRSRGECTKIWTIVYRNQSCTRGPSALSLYHASVRLITTLFDPLFCSSTKLSIWQHTRMRQIFSMTFHFCLTDLLRRAQLLMCRAKRNDSFIVIYFAKIRAFENETMKV